MPQHLKKARKRQIRPSIFNRPQQPPVTRLFEVSICATEPLQRLFSN